MSDSHKAPTPIPILLFKTPNPTPSADPYNLILSQSSSSYIPIYSPSFVPVLQESYDLTELIPVIEAGPERWRGLIVTSRRGMEAWVKGVRSQQSGKSKEKDEQGGWNNLPLLAVGRASTEHLLGADIPDSYKPRPVPQIIEDPPKSAGHLSKLILATFPEEDSATAHLPFLFLCGDKALEEMPKALRQGGKKVKDLVVYLTEGRNDVQEKLLDMARQEEKGWLAFFSPSSAALVMPYIRAERSASKWKGWKIFAIGESTRRYLEDSAGVEVHAVAERPDAEAMLEAIERVSW